MTLITFLTLDVSPGFALDKQKVSKAVGALIDRFQSTLCNCEGGDYNFECEYNYNCRIKLIQDSASLWATQSKLANIGTLLNIGHICSPWPIEATVAHLGRFFSLCVHHCCAIGTRDVVIILILVLVKVDWPCGKAAHGAYWNLHKAAANNREGIGEQGMRFNRAWLHTGLKQLIVTRLRTAPIGI